MRTLSTLSLALLFAACGPTDWSEIRSKEGRFSIRMPAIPVEKTREVQTEAGPLTLRSWNLDHQGRHYTVSFSDYPEAFVTANDPETVLDRARQGATAAVAGKLLEERHISLGEHSGRFMVVLDGRGDRVLQIRLLLIGARLYQFGIVTPIQDRSGAEVERFLDSFALLQN
jgi:hypothetical protein